MERSTFTIEFPEHLPREKWQYILIQLAETAETIEEQSEKRFVIVCEKPKQLSHVGWALFHTHFKSMCQVVATSGDAVANASAYKAPQKD